MSGRPFVVREFIRWSDVDLMGIIRYDAYTRFYELAESELWRAIGVPHSAFLERFGIMLPRCVMHVDYVSSPVLDERLEVRTYVSQVGTTSLTLNFDIYGAAGMLRSKGYLLLVCVEADVRNITKRPWPEEFIRLLEPYRMSVEAARGVEAATQPRSSV